MRFSAIVPALLSAGVALGEVITVQVGGNNSLTYNPPSVNATVGDTIMFEFMSKNHTITQSTFADPCTLMTLANGTTGVDSGFMPVAANSTSFPTFSFTLQNASAPLWFYCKQTGHCAKGMVFAINPTAAKSFSAFQAAAEKTASGSNSTGGGAGSASGSAGAGGAAGTASGTAATTSSTSTTSGAGAVRVGGAAFMLSVVGLVAGLL
ncbi:Cupredoxin [Fomitopsis serialis]|uniref:Cupredoxin n=1 Tax=Fomitopsis serialis TaxID=139415 RepID=UPI00200899D9|nr:Cupredoxin [Neoantrodia serialis]KAH9930623.1 Cupredoxin [Neoantrodia serialis]